jgi:hypothetical protein
MGAVDSNARTSFRPEYIERAIVGEVGNVAGAAPGSRNEALNRAAFNLATLGIADNEIVAALTPAARQCGLKQTEIDATLASGIKAGRANPRPAPVNGGGNGHARPRFRVVPPPPPPTKTTASGLPPCDAPNKFEPSNEPPIPVGEVRRHVYCRDGRAVRVKIKLKRNGEASYLNWYAVEQDGVVGWQASKPAGFVPVPYLAGLDPFDPELARDLLLWPEGGRTT